MSKSCGRIRMKLGGWVDSILVQVRIQIRPISGIENVKCSVWRRYALHRVLFWFECWFVFMNFYLCRVVQTGWHGFGFGECSAAHVEGSHDEGQRENLHQGSVLFCCHQMFLLVVLNYHSWWCTGDVQNAMEFELKAHVSAFVTQIIFTWSCPHGSFYPPTPF